MARKRAEEHLPDYVAFGSEQHRDLLGLREATDDDPEVFVFEGYTLVDPTQYLIMDPRGDLVRHITRQRVNELRNAPPTPQSEDPRKPNYAPPMHRPRELVGLEEE